MSLTSAQRQRVNKSIAAAFSRDELRRMVAICMEVDFDHVVPDKDFATQVFELVQWAERQGRTVELVRCAQDNNPGNEALRLVREELDVGTDNVRQPMPPPVIDRTAQLGIEWVPIPAGEFLMGSNKKKDKKAVDDETPPHMVHLPKYRIASMPVTVAQFAVFVQATDYVTTAEQKGSAWVWTGVEWENVAGANWQHPRGPASDVRQKQKHPVTCVSWHDAQAFCVWADVRLPSEAEWEKAARGTDGRIWPWGNDAPDVGHCNFNLNVGDTTPVGMYPKGTSPFGVLDMAGNVWEWTSSLWGPDPKTPQFGYPYRAGDGREKVDAIGSRALRGGAWLSIDFFVRCACRSPYNSVIRDSDYIGFRVVSLGY